jgi:serine/threonine-protein kinase HipA
MIRVLANKNEAGILEFNKKDREFIFNYTKDNPISLTMPYQQKSYLSSYHLHPIFDMNMPEGYLFELFKKLLTKEHGDIDDFVLFTYLSRTIDGYLTYENRDLTTNKLIYDLDAILKDRDENLFSKLIEKFLHNSAISGVQPKVLAPLTDKATLSTKEYIIKSFSPEFPHLAENEYFCMKALNLAGIKTPRFWLSESKKLFITEKFTYQKLSDEFYGFEEFCVLFEYTKDKKYMGSYEKIAKAITKISTKADEDLRDFFKMVVMNFLLKNGDGHLKNYGILYTSDKRERFLAPAYDVVNTIVYLPKDKPALNLDGKKIWWDKETLIDFGTKFCLLNKTEARKEFDRCIKATTEIIIEIEDYIQSEESFEAFGKRFLAILRFSLEHIDDTFKELPSGVL